MGRYLGLGRRLLVVACAALSALAWLVRAPADARAQNLEYSAIDAATVRVFAFKRVTAERVQSAAGNNYVLGMPEAGHGSGLLVSADGLILTARHVIEGAYIVAVQFPGAERAVPARVVYTDGKRDHAFLVVPGSYKVFAQIPDPGPKLAVRQTVYVIGYPLDATRKEPQSQQGIISGVLPDGSLQLGVALNPGNSGGPVTDQKEQLIGIAVARADPTAGHQGIGVAVPTEHILEGYRKAIAGNAIAIARRHLNEHRSRHEADADVISAVLTTNDLHDAFDALRGKPGARIETTTVARRIDAAIMAHGGPSADVLALAASNFWNAAAADIEFNQSADARLGRARDFATKARATDPEIVKRSPFVAFVLQGYTPTDAGAALPQAEDDSPAPASAPAASGLTLDEFYRSVEVHRTLPPVRIGPSIGITAPFQLFGIGVTAKLSLGELVHLDARYQYGWQQTPADNESGHYFEGLAGIRLGTWNGMTTAKLVVDVEHRFSHAVVRYVPGQVPTVHALVAEAGLVTGAVNTQFLSLEFGTPVLEDGVDQIYVLEGGIRYIYHYRASSPYLVSSARNTVEVSGHVLAPPLGLPDDATNASGNEIRSLPGFKTEVAWGGSLLAWGQTEAGLGFFPSGKWFYLRLGWSYLFY